MRMEAIAERKSEIIYYPVSYGTGGAQPTLIDDVKTSYEALPSARSHANHLSRALSLSLDRRRSFPFTECRSLALKWPQNESIEATGRRLFERT